MCRSWPSTTAPPTIPVNGCDAMALPSTTPPALPAREALSRAQCVRGEPRRAAGAAPGNCATRGNGPSGSTHRATSSPTAAGRYARLDRAPLQRLPQAQALAVTMHLGPFATRDVTADQLSFGEGARARPPSPWEATPGTAVLGDLVGRQTPAVGCVRQPEWSSVSVGSTTISTAMLCALARAAGTHVRLETDDVVIVGKRHRGRPCIDPAPRPSPPRRGQPSRKRLGRGPPPERACDRAHAARGHKDSSGSSDPREGGGR